MSIRVMTEVWRTNLPTTEKMVLLVIADHASDDGTNAYPSQATIATKASISVRTVQRCVNNLIRLGFIHMDKHAGGSANCREDRRPHLYTIHLNKLRGDIMSVRELRRDIDDTNEATLTAETGRHTRPKNHTNKPSLEPSKYFDDFWEIYPRKVAKGDARKAWEKAIQKATATDIIIGANRFASDPNRHPTFTPHPSTWLNQERWGDEPLPPREIDPVERKAQELIASRERAEREKVEYAKWLEEVEEQKKRAVPPPPNIRDLFKKP